MIIAIVGAGFIGKHLIRAFQPLGCEIRVLDRNPCPPEFESHLLWLRADYRDRSALRQVYQTPMSYITWFLVLCLVI